MSAGRKPGVASDEEFEAFLVENAKKTVVVVDARNTNFEVEPDDAKFGDVDGRAPITDCGSSRRPNAINVAFDRSLNCLNARGLEVLDAKTNGDLSTPIVTHCGGGGRGQKAKDALLKLGYTNVINGGGPAVEELWAKFGSF